MDKDKFIEVVDNITSTISKHHNILEGNEAQTRWMLIDPFILDCLGYSREDVRVEYSIDKEDRVSKYDALDYCVVLNNKPKLLIEAKSLGINLYSKVPQLSEYFTNIYMSSDYKQKELIGVLTDGDLYLFFTDSKEQGVLDTEPFFTLRMSLSDEEEIEKLLNISKNRLLNNKVFVGSDEEDYDLNEFYRIDMIEKVFNHYESQGVQLGVHNVYLCGRLKKINSLKSLYREILKRVNILQPYLLYNLVVDEERQSIEGSISECIFSLSGLSDSIEISTNQGIVYASLPRTRKGVIDRIVWVLQKSSIGLVNVNVRLRYK